MRTRRALVPLLAAAALGTAGAPAAATPAAHGFVLEETTVARIHHAFARGTLTCAEDQAGSAQRFPGPPNQPDLRGTVTAPSHKYVDNRTIRRNVTNTFNSGEAD